jgi:hypothetical protein
LAPGSNVRSVTVLIPTELRVSVVNIIVVLPVGTQLGFLVADGPVALQLGSATAVSPATPISSTNRAATIIRVSIRLTVFHLLT